MGGFMGCYNGWIYGLFFGLVYVRIPASAFSRWGRPRAAGARMPASHRTATRAPKEQDIARIVGMVHAWAGV